MEESLVRKRIYGFDERVCGWGANFRGIRKCVCGWHWPVRECISHASVGASVKLKYWEWEKKLRLRKIEDAECIDWGWDSALLLTSKCSRVREMRFIVYSPTSSESERISYIHVLGKIFSAMNAPKIVLSGNLYMYNKTLRYIFSQCLDIFCDF